MMRSAKVVIGLFIFAWAAEVRAIDVPACKGAVVPSLSGKCLGVSSAGCCDAKGRVFWCDKSDLYCVDCGKDFPYCGWSPFGYYDCGAAEGSADPSGANPRQCGGCDGSCDAGAPCSPKCPGACGTCPSGAICLDSGVCHVPACEGRECGPDPEGISCGYCPEGKVCVEGLYKCLSLPAPCQTRVAPGCDGCGCEACVCAKHPQCCKEHWDTYCAASCEKECGYLCSACPDNPTCDGIACGDFCGLQCGACPPGQVCRQFACCQPDCEGRECGPDGCGGTCGSCKGNDDCVGGKCVPCQPKCAGLQCGDDSCGGSCGTCAMNEFCNAGKCSKGGCDGHCGDGSSSFPCGPDCACYCDEVCFSYGDCCEGICDVCPELEGCCKPKCDHKACGDDGCGGSCGTCGPGTTCENGICVKCVPKCEGKACGDDGCNGSCGDCPAGKECVAFQCTDCVPKCAGKQCGDDGCGGTCGACAGPGKTCINGECLTTNCGGVTWEGCCNGNVLLYCDGSLKKQDCVEPTCGWNATAAYYDCNTDGSPDPSGKYPRDCPSCKPSCEGVMCGDDGCGGSCGTCPSPTQCVHGLCLAPACGAVTEVGCCAGEKLQYCFNGSLFVMDCGKSPLCGFSQTAGVYACGTDGQADPLGLFPKDCAGCAPLCPPGMCGDDGCGGKCPDCPSGQWCDAGICKESACGPISREGCCDGETLRRCDKGEIQTLDCAGQFHCGWNPGIGAYACGTDGMADPSGKIPKACPCVPDCKDKECGPNGCGGECGVCKMKVACVYGKCLCTPECAWKQCGDDGCGGSCGTCADGLRCESGLCLGPGADVADSGPDLPAVGDGLAGDPALDAVFAESSPDSAGGGGGGCTASGSPFPCPSALILTLISVLFLVPRRRLAKIAVVAVCAAGCSLGGGAPDAVLDPGISTDADISATDLAPDPGLSPDLPPDLPDAADSGPADPGIPDIVEVPPDVADPGPDLVDSGPPDPGSDLGSPDTGPPPDVDCENLPPGPFVLEPVPGAIASEDLAFDSDGYLVGSNNETIFKTDAHGKAMVFVPNVHQRAGMRFLPNGMLAVNDDQLGRVLLFAPDGSMTVLVQGLSYPNGMTVDMKGFLYVTEHDANRVLRIHPFTGEYTVLTDKIPNPNGIVFDPTYKRLYIGSFTSGRIYTMSLSPDGVPGKVVEWADPTGEGGMYDGMGVDICGNVYVCEYGNTDVWRVPPEGGKGVRIVDASPEETYLPNLQWGVGKGWDPYSIYLPDGWNIGLWRVRIGVPSAPRPYP